MYHFLLGNLGQRRDHGAVVQGPVISYNNLNFTYGPDSSFLLARSEILTSNAVEILNY